MKVYYPKGLPGHLVVNVAGALQIVPMNPDGWARRTPYLGHRAALLPVAAHEAEIQLRSAGWVPPPVSTDPNVRDAYALEDEP